MANYISLIRRRAWLIALGGVVGLIAGIAVAVLNDDSGTARTSHSATATIFFTFTASNDVDVADRLAQLASFAELIDSGPVLASVEEEIDGPAASAGSLDAEPAVLEQVQGGSIRYVDTHLIDVTAVSSTPPDAEELARAGAEALASQANRLETVQPQVRAEVFGEPTVESVPVEAGGDSDFRIIGLALLGGLVLGVAVAILREAIDPTIRDPRALSEGFGLRVVGTTTLDSRLREQPLVFDFPALRGSASLTAGVEGRSPRAEEYRRLRLNLPTVNADHRGPMVVASPGRGEGRTTVACNLAAAFVAAGKSVALVDGDLRNPRIADLLGIDPTPGLAEVLSGDVDLSETIVERGPGILPAGRTQRPGELLESSKLADVVRALEQSFAVVLVDSPPLVPFADAAVFATTGASALILARYGKTTAADLELAVQTLTATPATIVGAALTMVPGWERPSPLSVSSPAEVPGDAEAAVPGVRGSETRSPV
jgi:capsular exopolysaccharide synthesis family protein